MSIFSRIMKSVIRPVFRKIVGFFNSVIKQVYIDLDSTASAHYLLAKPVVFAGDFEIGVTFSTTATSDLNMLIGFSVDTTTFIYVDGVSGLVSVRLPTAIDLTGSRAVNDGSFHTVEVIKTGTTYKLFVDGVSDGVQTGLSGIVTFDQIGCNALGNYFEGIISQVDLIDLTNLENSEYYKLNELTKDYELPVNNVFGSELYDFANVGTTEGVSITQTPTGYSVVTSVDNKDRSYINFATEIGKVYLVSGVQVVNTDAAIITWFARNGTNGNGAVYASSSLLAPVLSFVAESTTSTILMDVSTNAAPITYEYDNITLREVTNVLTYENIALDKRDTYTLEDGDWLGSELVTQAIWENPDRSQAEWSFANNKWTLTGTGDFQELRLINAALQPNILRFSGTAEDILGNIATQNSNTHINVINSNGPYSLSMYSSIGSNQVFKRQSGVANVTLTKPSYKRLIEVAPQLAAQSLIDLDSTTIAHYLLAKPWQPAGDYSIKSTVYFTGLGLSLTGNASNFNSRVSIDSTGSINWRAESGSSTAITAPSATVPENQLSIIEVVRIGSAGTIYVNGVSVASGAVPTGALDLEVFGRNSTSYASGIISQVNLTDITTPANSLEFKLNELTQEYELPVNNVFGSEEVVNGDFASGTDNWSSGSGSSLSASDGVMTVESPAPDSFGNANQSFATVLGVSYEVVISVGAEVGATSIPMGIASTPTSVRDIVSLDSNDGDVIQTGHFVGDGSTVYIVIGVLGSGATVEVNSASIREVTNYLTYENIALDKRDHYIPVDGVLLGSELVVNGDFATDSDWSKGAGWSISGGSAIAAASSASITQSIVFLEGVSYEVTYDAVITSGSVSARFTGGANTNGASRSVTGTYTEVLTAQAGNTLFRFTASAFTGSIDNVSVKRQIEVA